MKGNYFKSVFMVEKLHSLFLEVMKVELSRMEITDINKVQCLLLYNVGQKKVTVGELTSRGYYVGSNVSYNLRKLVKNGYIIQKKNNDDRRSSLVFLSSKGINLIEKLQNLFVSHEENIFQEGNDLDNMIPNLEVFWKGLITKDSHMRLYG